MGRQGKRKLVHFLELLEEGKTEALYRFLITLFDDPVRQQLYTPGFREQLERSLRPMDEWLFGADERNQLLSLQYRDWLPDLMLLKQDKLTMAHSLEGRFLFMDHELVSYVSSLPGNFKIRGRYDKLLLRRYAAEKLRLPASRRPKKPFFIPVEQMKGFDTHFHNLNFLDLSGISRGHGEFLERRREISLWMLDLFFQAHRLEPDFG
jgi:asparagine synthetase B (glutamine-hydrolysing)